MSASTSLPRSASAVCAKSAAAKRRSSAPAAEELLEEIAEAGAAEFKFNTAISAAVTMESAARLLSAPSRRRLKSARLIPIRAELIVFLPLLRIAQDFVGFVDLLEFFLRRRLILGFATSGWYLRASLRNALLISSSLAVFETPSVS